MDTISTEMMMKGLTLAGVAFSSAAMSRSGIPVPRRATLFAIAVGGIVLMLANALIALSPLAIWLDAAYAMVAIGFSGAWYLHSIRSKDRRAATTRSPKVSRSPGPPRHEDVAMPPIRLSALGVGRVDEPGAPNFARPSGRTAVAMPKSAGPSPRTAARPRDVPASAKHQKRQGAT